MLSKNSITYINIGESDDLRDLYDAVLEIDELGRGAGGRSALSRRIKRVLQSWVSQSQLRKNHVARECGVVVLSEWLYAEVSLAAARERAA